MMKLSFYFIGIIFSLTFIAIYIYQSHKIKKTVDWFNILMLLFISFCIAASLMLLQILLIVSDEQIGVLGDYKIEIILSVISMLLLSVLQLPQIYKNR